MSKKKWIFPAAIFVITALISYAGLFLFVRDKGMEGGDKNAGQSTAATMAIPLGKPVKHVHLSKAINGKKQEINILEVNPSAKGVRIIPALSYDLVYGYEMLSSIAARNKAYAAVNAGFFLEYGLPSGMVASDGNVYTLPTGKYPVFTVENGTAALGDYEMKVWIEYAGTRFKADRLNMPPTGAKLAVYTPKYGATNRAEGENYTIVVKDGSVVEAGLRRNAVEIPKDGFVIMGDVSAFPALSSENKNSSGGINVGDVSLLLIKKGDLVGIQYEPQTIAGLQAYECGSWFIRNGKLEIGDKDAWIGVTTNNDPRTAIGIKEDGTVVLLTVDGRQPGISEGMTCSELGRFLLEYGVRNAAMLDGGASTEMIVQGAIVNKPSYKGQERPVGGGIIIVAD